LDVFSTHGKIYEASASMMFGVPIEKIDKGSDLRTKGKIAELALGYQGALGALKKMGGESMGLTDSEMTDIVKKWRNKNPQITKLWKHVEAAAKRAIKTRKKVILSRFRNLEFEYDGNVLTIQLPSGRKLFYQSPAMTTNRFGQESIKYKGLDQVTKKWWWVDSYGGKFVENIVQAIARDLLADSMLRLDENGFDIVMHVHDEAICEIPEENSDELLDEMCDIMGTEVPWAEGLPLVADGYVTPFYKKD
jgi:DNA polymerase